MPDPLGVASQGGLSDEDYLALLQRRVGEISAPTPEAPIRSGAARADKGSFFSELLPLLIAGAGDIAASGMTGKSSTAALGTTLQLREQTEKRKEREGTQAISLLRLAKEESQQKFAQTEKLLDQAGKLAARFSILPPEAAQQAKDALLQLAKAQGIAGTDKIMSAIFTNPESLGPITTSYLKYLPEGMGRILFPTLLKAAETGNLEQAVDQIRAASMHNVYGELFDRIDRLGGERDSFKGPIPLTVLEKSLDPVQDHALFEALRGTGAFGKGLDVVKDRLAARGFQVPGVQAKVAEQRALEGAKPLALDKDVEKALIGAGLGGIVKTFDPDNPIHAAAFRAAEETVKGKKLDMTALEERARQEVRAEFGEGKTLAERIADLREQGKTDRADRILALQKEMKENIQINLPKTPPVEIIKDVQTVKLAARRLSRTVEQFDPTFVGILGKLKGLSTKFSDIPGIPAFKERKAFANDLIAMTNDIKKTLLGAARTVPELADVARFLPDPDQSLSVAEFVGNMSSFMRSYVDIIDVLPPTLKELDIKSVDLSTERESLAKAMVKLDAIMSGLGIEPGLRIRAIRKK